MAVAVRRPGFALWLAWVAAAAIAAAVAVWANLNFVGRGETGPAVAIELDTPAILGQFLVLRALAHIPGAAAAVWVGLSLVAAAIVPEMEFPWFAAVFHPVIDWSIAKFPLTTAMTIEGYVLGLMHLVFPLLFGLAEGVALAWMMHRYWVAAVWVWVCLLAGAIASPLAGYVIVYRITGPPTGLDWILANLVPNLIYFSAFAAVTGAGLVAVLRLWAPRRV